MNEDFKAEEITEGFRAASRFLKANKVKAPKNRADLAHLLATYTDEQVKSLQLQVKGMHKLSAALDEIEKAPKLGEPHALLTISIHQFEDGRHHPLIKDNTTGIFQLKGLMQSLVFWADHQYKCLMNETSFIPPPDVNNEDDQIVQ